MFDEYKMGLGSGLSDLVEFGLYSVAQAHHMHLVTTSYARHMALGEYYTGIPALIDRIAETALSEGFQIELRTPMKRYDKAEVMLQDLYERCDRVSKLLVKSPNDKQGIQNAVQDTIEFINGVMYKLKRFQ